MFHPTTRGPATGLDRGYVSPARDAPVGISSIHFVCLPSCCTLSTSRVPFPPAATPFRPTPIVDSPHSFCTMESPNVFAQ